MNRMKLDVVAGQGCKATTETISPKPLTLEEAAKALGAKYVSTTTKPGVLAVMEEARALAADQRDMHDDNNNTPMADSWESFRADVVAARATVERTGDALADAVDWIASMRCDDAITHPRLKVLRAALAAYRGEA